MFRRRLLYLMTLLSHASVKILHQFSIIVEPLFKHRFAFEKDFQTMNRG